MFWFGPSHRDGIWRALPPEKQRLVDAVETIAGDAATLSLRVRRGALLPAPASGAAQATGPIRWSPEARLFDLPGGGHRFYRFSYDMKGIEDEGSLTLFFLFGWVAEANLLVNTARGRRLTARQVSAVLDLLDRILVTCAFLAGAFRGHAVSRRLHDELYRPGRGPRLSPTARRLMIQAHRQDVQARLAQAERAMSRPERLDLLLPHRGIPLTVDQDCPPQPGEAILRGVYFPPDEARMLRDHLAAQQIEATRAAS